MENPQNTDHLYYGMEYNRRRWPIKRPAPPKSIILLQREDTTTKRFNRPSAMHSKGTPYNYYAEEFDTGLLVPINLAQAYDIATISPPRKIILTDYPITETTTVSDVERSTTHKTEHIKRARSIN